MVLTYAQLHFIILNIRRDLEQSLYVVEAV